eukprot:scaffold50_cov114-Amphora_coffeaeformis.AAC.3
MISLRLLSKFSIAAAVALSPPSMEADLNFAIAPSMVKITAVRDWMIRHSTWISSIPCLSSV